MNWQLFNPVGYASVLLLLCIPLLWLAQLALRRWWWLSHLAVLIAVAGLVLAKVHSLTHLSRLEVDYSQQIEAQLSRQAMAHRAAQDERAGEVADIRFAEDATGEFIDKGGLDNDRREYFDNIDNPQTPDWKKNKQQRVEGGGDDAEDLDAMIGAKAPRKGADVPDDFTEQQADDSILVTDQQKQLADRLDRANRNAGWVLLVLAGLFLAVDYMRRLNRYDQAYGPLPVPSSWADAMSPRKTVIARPARPRRSVWDELRFIARRGESFVCCTDDAELARRLLAGVGLSRLPMGLRPVRVVGVGEDAKFDDDFIFESLWFGRTCFVIESAQRAEAMMDRFLQLLAERRGSRAHTRVAVHVVWDLPEPIEDNTLHRFATLGKATGCTLMITRQPATHQRHEPDEATP